MSTTTQRRPDAAPRLKHVRASGAAQGRLATRVQARDFTFVTGEPPAIGGDDAGPTPMEYVVGALTGCLVVVIETVAAEHTVSVQDLQVAADAVQDVRGFAGTADVPPYFHHLTLTVTLRTDASASQVARLRADVERRCPAYRLISAAGVTVDATWTTGGAA